MFKLSVIAFVLVSLGAVQAGSLEWPANLVALSQAKSPQAVPLPASEESAELEAESSASSAAAEPEADAEEAPTESSSKGSADPLDARLISAVPVPVSVPVSVPLPLIVAARPGLRSVLTIQEPTVAKVGHLVEHVPTAISHQSQTVVHEHRRLVTPIVAPAVRTTQLVRQQPHLLWTLSTADPRVLYLRN
ncbi:hypothetical protein ACLKA7_017518 [Drosophila subpalustris]